MAIQRASLELKIATAMANGRLAAEQMQRAQPFILTRPFWVLMNGR
jgi:hypothetical protein